MVRAVFVAVTLGCLALCGSCTPSQPFDPKTFVWVRKLTDGDHSTARPQALCGSAGCVYVAGEGRLPRSVGTGHLFIRKYSLEGAELWTRGFAEGRRCFLVAASAAPSGGYIVGQADGDDTDAFLMRLGADGTELWYRQFGTDGNDVACGVSPASDGVYVVVASHGALQAQPSAGDFGSFLRKYDTSAKELWTQRLVGAGMTDPTAVSASDSGVYVAGVAGAAAPGGREDGGALVSKYAADGTVSWTRQLRDWDVATSVSADHTGVYAAGYRANALSEQASDLFREGTLFISRYSSTGTEAWTQSFEGIVGRGEVRVAASATAVYLLGPFFVTRYQADGTRAWTVRIGRNVGGWADAGGAYVVGDKMLSRDEGVLFVAKIALEGPE